MPYTKKKPIIIVDGSLYLYRSYFTFQNFNSNEENPSGAIYGMLKTIQNILNKNYNSKKIIIIFDSSKKNFRNTIFKEYKSNRSAMPNKLYVQIQPLFKILEEIGIKTLSILGIEADDIIGSLAYKLEQKGEQVLIVSHDKDMIQLITDNINVLNISKNSILTPEKIQEKYGIYPKEFIDLLALMGDSSDNIPGVPKIGIKTALFLLKKFSNIKNIYNNIEKIQSLPFRNAKNAAIQLKNYKKTAFLSYQLAKIKLDVPINITSEEITLKKTCFKKLSNLIRWYSFNE
ncbi:5'-3' exonuclease [Buchnera aphidicola]|jgi:DNA polymerase-1|uniref:5'-3' exonuclease n=1 Tax=Buchnera aphidicola subsp. Schizaphis graminum (strain Sg) TaxID=198804 RepID=EX53_BUCAP|nr:5'-3' exonuclease [Buchnera aphidicola]Q8K9D0.1 RecName: Full=5'-3' exonuclease [Buchnera aphidicola str. Sg (Schizaphis graminum)]AAM67961.1 DNA polymerase I 3'-5' exo domain [Buchnera aphidicola str. Sg (Schizaphis graminum)]AWI49546.1 5'-3' exonuclease [Buchnera aphidicola (Schizaphis graminum)]